METGLVSPKAGYVQLVNEPKTIKGHLNPESFKKQGLSINGYYAMEINEHGALIFDKEGKALAMVDKEDIVNDQANSKYVDTIYKKNIDKIISHAKAQFDIIKNVNFNVNLQD
jgi:hypothetical protein